MEEGLMDSISRPARGSSLVTNATPSLMLQCQSVLAQSHASFVPCSDSDVHAEQLRSLWPGIVVAPMTYD
jgi:hypothetical protein